MRNLSIFLLFSFVLFGCKKEKTSWLTDWQAPAGYDTLTFNSLVNDSTLSNSNNLLSVDLTRTLFNIGLSDIVAIPDTTIKQNFNPALNLNNIPPGYTFVNQIETHEIELNPIQLREIRVASGKIKVKVYNPISTKALFTVQLPGVTKNGQVFQQSYSVEGGTPQNPGAQEEFLDLGGYSINLAGPQGVAYNKIQSKLTIQTDPNGGEISISTSNNFRFEATFSEIKMDYARGYFGNQIIEENSNFEIPFLNKIISGNIELPETSLQIQIENGLKVAMRGRILGASNTNTQNQTVNLSGQALNSDFILSPATGNSATLNPSQQIISFNGNNSNIKNYLENLGHTHNLQYRFQLNPWGNTGGGFDEIFANSKLKLTLKAQLPLSLNSNGLTLKDTFNLDLSQNTERTHVQSGNLVLNYSNAFPFSADLTLYLADENGIVLHTVIPTASLLSSVLGVANNNGIMVKKGQLSIPLNKEVISDIGKIKKVIVEARFDSPNETSSQNIQQQVSLGAFLAVKIKAQFQTKIIL
jgi:hypothetical protein